MNLPNKNSVKHANKKLYNAIAKDYDNIDGRRSISLKKWIINTLSKLKSKTEGNSLLDLGTGSGLITDCANGIFLNRIGIDISSEILKANILNYSSALVSDIDHLPFKDNSFDVITCFAVLHHLFSFEDLVKEAYRILKPGGIFYSDHDMDLKFYNRFKPLLKVYRSFHNSSKKYQDANPSISQDIYKLTEIHENGVDSNSLKIMLINEGFDVETKYHWYGLNPLTDKVFAQKTYNHGCAPLISFKATKRTTN